MSIRAATVVTLAPLLVACAGSSAGGHTSPSTRAGSVGCSGWFQQTGGELLANLSFRGPVRSVRVSARLKDGGHLDLPGATPVAAGETSTSLRLPARTNGSIVSARAHVSGRADERSDCVLSNPH